MEEQWFTIDRYLGPVVPVTIGLSFAEEDRQRAFGHTPHQEPVYGVISPAEQNTLISRALSLRLDQKSCVGTVSYQSVTQARAIRARFVVTLHIDGFAPRTIDAIATELFEPLECIIGRDFLSAGAFSYYGDRGEFVLRLPGT